ncbi:MAG: glycosyltransferase [Phycisphaerales bacterium JB040]
MRLVHYFKRMNLEDGGVVRCVLDLTATLAAAGHDVTLLTHDRTDVPEEWVAGTRGVPTVRTLPAPARALGRFGGDALRAVAGHLDGADALHLHAMWEPTNTQLARVARRAGVPYVLSTHGMLDDWSMGQKAAKKRLYHALVERRLLAGAAAVHCTARGELDQAKKWFPQRLGRVVPLVFDLAPFDPGPGPERARDAFPGFGTGEPTVVFMSRLHVKKGVEHLIDAARLLADRGTPAQFLIAGTGEEGYVAGLRERAARAGVGARCHFLGMVSGADKVSLLQAADLSALPTSQENFGFAIVEAMAAGTPVIITRGVDIWPELEQSGGAVLIEQAPGPLADAIAGLASDPERLGAMSDAARGWARATFAGSAIADRYVELYRSLGAAGGDG